MSEQGSSSNAPDIKDEVESVYSERSKKRRYKNKKEKNPSSKNWTKLEDPEAPRKPRSAYVHFLSSRRATYGTVKQGCDQKSINVALAAEWQGLTPEKRQVYQDIAQKERTEYEKAMISYQQTEQYATFMQKKQLIMTQRKQCRKLGVESDRLMENIIMGNGGDGSNKRRRLVEPHDLSTVPLLENTEISIFSKEFLSYNKEKESQLRHIRRACGVEEDAQTAMQATIARAAANLQQFDLRDMQNEKFLAANSATLNLWTQLASQALATHHHQEPGQQSPESVLAALNAILTQNTSHANSVKSAIQSMNFLPKI